MCGISGWIGSTSIPVCAEKFCDNSLRFLSHRGPDGNGFWIEKQKRAVFCHTRLAIIGVDKSGAQPMSCVSGKWQIVFNGEIYNYLSLRSELIKYGYVFTSKTDTEVIAASFDRWGIEAFSKFRGMYAVALWNNEQCEGFLARDPFGIKPLYIKRKSEGLFFSSEIRALIKASNSTVKLNTSATAAYLATGSVPEPLTIISGIEVVQPGAVLCFKNGAITCENQIDPYSISNEPCNIQNEEQKIRNSFLDSVNSHLVSDVPVGLFLSGGLDSTCIAASLSILGNKNTACFNISFGNHSLSEAGEAKKTAVHFGLKFHGNVVTRSEILRLFNQYQSNLDQPTIDGLNVFTVSQFAASFGFKVVLSGLGGDELFAGYSSFHKLPLIFKICGSQNPVTNYAADFFNTLEKPKTKRIRDILVSSGDFGAIYRSFRGIFSETEIFKIMNLLDNTISYRKWKKYTDTILVNKEILETISKLEIKKYMLNQLLRDSDVMSMANNLELRVPFLDTFFYNSISQINPQKRYQIGKKMLAKAFPEIPSWVVNAPKRGFLFPMQSWLRDILFGKKSWISEKTGIDTKVWYRKIALLNFEEWMKKNLGVEVI